MKLPYLASIAAFSFANLWTQTSSVNAGEIDFACGSWRDKPVTVAQTPNRNVILIEWATDWVQNSSDDPSLSPQSRCETVSDNFQQAYDSGQLEYITTGFKDGQSIICVAEYYEGPCESQLFTLKPGSDPKQSLNQLMKISNNDASRSDGPLVQSSGERIYVDFNDFLNNAPELEN